MKDNTLNKMDRASWCVMLFKKKPDENLVKSLEFEKRKYLYEVINIHISARMDCMETTIGRFFSSVSTCISERVFSHLEGMCSDCK